MARGAVFDMQMNSDCFTSALVEPARAGTTSARWFYQRACSTSARWFKQRAG